jgi:opacity protein-like surface antigen
MPGCRRVLRGVWVTAALLATATATAESSDAESSDSEPLQVSISPFVGYRIGGGFKLSDTGQDISLDNHDSFAVAVDVRTDTHPDTDYELFYSRQSTALRGNGFVPVRTVVEYLHVGGTVGLDDDDLDRIKPYFGAGLGATRLSPGLAPGREDTRFSLSLALGLRAPISPHFSLRLEARGYFTPVNSDTRMFCDSNQASSLCQVRVRGSALWQGDFLAGATYTF